MRLIDADLLEPDADYDDGEFWAVSMAQIQGAPVIEPKRETGEWIPVEEDDIPYGLLVECSECGNRIIINDALVHNYCSECGADMRGE